jgi:hypothetical protein
MRSVSAVRLSARVTWTRVIYIYKREAFLRGSVVPLWFIPITTQLFLFGSTSTSLRSLAWSMTVMGGIHPESTSTEGRESEGGEQGALLARRIEAIVDMT